MASTGLDYVLPIVAGTRTSEPSASTSTRSNRAAEDK